MTAFAYRDGALHADAVALADIAAAVGTPFYCYSATALADNYRGFADALAGLPATICYSVKANSNLAVIRALAALGAGADVVSEGELRRALAAGVAPERIVFSGVGKSRSEMEYALAAGIAQFNVESEPELVALSELAAESGRTAAVAIRVNPDVDAGTHDKIATGRREDKFGIGMDTAPAVYRRAASLDGIAMVGLAVHIGSQLTSLEPFRTAFARVATLASRLEADGFRIARLDLGGGLGIVYDSESPPHPDDYAAMVRDVTEGLDCELLFEPGRLLVGNAGVLVTRVIYVKDGATRRFVIVDAAMNDLMRPALYGAHHVIEPVREPDPGTPRSAADVVGPVCETGDILAVQRDMPALAADDLLAIRSAGAYGAVMASVYNSRLLVPEIMVDGDRFAVVRARTDYDTLLAQDRIPDWLDGT